MNNQARVAVNKVRGGSTLLRCEKSPLILLLVVFCFALLSLGFGRRCSAACALSFALLVRSLFVLEFPFNSVRGVEVQTECVVVVVVVVLLGLLTQEPKSNRNGKERKKENGGEVKPQVRDWGGPPLVFSALLR